MSMKIHVEAYMGSASSEEKISEFIFNRVVMDTEDATLANLIMAFGNLCEVLTREDKLDSNDLAAIVSEPALCHLKPE